MIACRLGRHWDIVVMERKERVSQATILYDQPRVSRCIKITITV